MEIKDGNRIHVTKFDGNQVDFYATVSCVYGMTVEIKNCTYTTYEEEVLYIPYSKSFGVNRDDYFELVLDEEDTETPVIIRINNMFNDVPTQHQDDKECKVCEPAHGRRYVRLRKLKGFITDHYLDYTLRVGKGYKGAKFKKHKLMLLDRGEVCAHVNINFCPMCGRKLKSSE